MKKATLLISAVTAVAIAAPLAIAQSKGGPFSAEIKARKSQMQVNKFYMGMLGAMAKGKRPYDAKMASDAAYNLQLSAMMQAGALWPKGSDMTNSQITEKTTAKPEAWAEGSKVGEKHKAWTDASKDLVKVAGNGLDAMRAALGPVGKSCKGCHDDYKAKPKK